LALPSTVHHKFFCDKQDLQMFGTKRGMYRQDNSLQHVKNVHIPIVFTSDGHIDKIYLEMYYDKCESKLNYEQWLALQNIRFYAQLEQLAILEPKVYQQALSTEKHALLKAYQTEFAENGAIGFEAWYDGQDKRPRHDGKLTTEYHKYSRPSSSAEDDEEGTDHQVYTSTPKGSMDEMSHEATASSPLFSSHLLIKKKEDKSMRVLLDGLLNHTTQRLPHNLRTVDKQEIAPKFPTNSQRATAKAMADEATFRLRLTTAEKDEIAREVSAISDRAAARIMDDNNDEFQRYVEATAKYGRNPTGLKFDHYTNADFIKRMNSRASARAESILDYKRILDIERTKNRVD
jgi:hypothetical protein